MKKTNYAAWGVILAAIPMLVGCSEDNDTNRTGKPTEIPLSGETRTLVDKGNQFCLDLLSAVSQENDDNFVISPLSIFTMNAMLANGDGGQARKEILNAMGLDDTRQNLDNLNDYCNSMLRTLPKVDANVSCLFANGIWANPELIPTDIFRTALDEYFNAEFRHVSPSGENGQKDINDWVSANTSGMINDFITTPFENISFAILNAVYFNGQWQEKFDKAKTKAATFHNNDGTESTHMQMQNSGFMNYLTTDDYDAVSLKYGNGNFEMIMALPNTDNDNLLSRKSLESLTSNFNSMMRLEVDLKMPRFEINSELDLIRIMPILGIKAPFDHQHGLNGVCSSAIVLGKFYQAVKIGVNEEGTEAASSSVSAGQDMSPGRTFITFDRPFIFMIRETTTGAILFAGRINRL